MYKGGEEVELGKFNTKGFEECAMLCSGSSACQFWAFDGSGTSGGKCKLTSTEPLEKLSVPNAHSGSRLCGRVENFTQSQGKFKDNCFKDRKCTIQVACCCQTQDIQPRQRRSTKCHSQAGPSVQL